MAAQTVSERANWNRRPDQRRQNSKWRRSSSGLARDPYHTPPEDQPSEIHQRSSELPNQRRVEQSAFRSNSEYDSLANSSANARLESRAYTTSAPSYNIHHYQQVSAVHTTPNQVLRPSPFITSSKSSRLAPSSSVHTFRVHNPRPASSREHIAVSCPASTMVSEVIDLTLEDTGDELSASDMMVPDSTNFNNQSANSGPSRRALSSGLSSPIALEQSLFTPPPPSRRRTRLFMDHLLVPSFPKGLTKADYQPMFDHSVVPLPGPSVADTLQDSSPANLSVTKERTPQKQKGKERELDVAPSPIEHRQRSPPSEEVEISDACLDAFYEHTIIPLYDVDTFPPLTISDLVVNTRFQFAHAWRGQVSRLREAELDCSYKFGVLEEAYTWARSVNPSFPRMPGTTGYVSSEQLRSWKLVLPDGSPQEKSTKYVLDEQFHSTDSRAVEVDANLSDDTLPGPSHAFDTVSNPTVSQGLMDVDIEHDMHRYFNGLSDSPAKHVSPCQQLASPHTFRPHLLQSARHAQMNSLGLRFPSLEPDSQVADTSGHECFFGVPPSPPSVSVEPSTVTRPIPDCPLEPLNFSPASPSNIFEASPTDAWSFEQGEEALPSNDSPPSNHVFTPTIPGTIDPSLLAPAQTRKLLRTPKDSTTKRRSKLPEPVIYIRRPMDSSSLPLLSGKRPVQIKYRDSGGSTPTPSTQTGANEAPSSAVGNAVEQPRNDTDHSPRVKRRSAPSYKLRECHSASGSDSDYIPEASTSKIKLKLKLKLPSLGDKASVVEHQRKIAESDSTKSYCHQCRNRSARPKMLCSNVVQGRVCGKRFCNRCILYRYPDITFDEQSAGFMCPVCTNTCNCSFCSRSRGEEFISMRLGGLATSLFRANVTFVRDIDKPLHRATSPSSNVAARRNTSATTTPTPEPGTLQGQSQFWAHVYGIEGERVGSAFMTRKHMERLQAHGPFSPPLLSNPQTSKKARKSTKRDKEREKAKGPRVFIGRPLASWNVRAVRDFEPCVDVATLGKEQGTSVVTSDHRHRRRRCYIGSPTSLYEPYRRMPGAASATPLPSERSSTPPLDSDGRLTPLSDLVVNDDWPQPDVGECCSWVPPPPSGMIVSGRLSNPSGVSGPLAKELPGPGPSGGTVDVWQGVDGLQGLGLSSSSSTGVDVDMDVRDERVSASTPLSEEDLARAINAALAALSVEPSS